MESHLRMVNGVPRTRHTSVLRFLLLCDDPSAPTLLRAPKTLQVRTGNHPLGLDLTPNLVFPAVNHHPLDLDFAP